jgi:hypothetical protein
MDVFNVEGSNVTAGDCVFLALMHDVRSKLQGRREVKDRDNGGAVIDLANYRYTVQQIRDMLHASRAYCVGLGYAKCLGSSRYPHGRGARKLILF